MEIRTIQPFLHYFGNVGERKMLIGRGSGGRRRWRSNCLRTEKIHGRLIELGAQLIAFAGARDVANGDLDAADDRLYVDGRRSRQRTHLARTRRVLPLLLEIGRAHV